MSKSLGRFETSGAAGEVKSIVTSRELRTEVSLPAESLRVYVRIHEPSVNSKPSPSSNTPLSTPSPSAISVQVIKVASGGSSPATDPET